MLHFYRRSQWPRGLRRGSATAHLMGLWVRIPPGGMDVCLCCECWVLSGRALCDRLITRPEDSYWLWCVVVCDLETSWMRRPWPTGGGAVVQKGTNIFTTNNIQHIPGISPWEVGTTQWSLCNLGTCDVHFLEYHYVPHSGITRPSF